MVGCCPLVSGAPAPKPEPRLPKTFFSVEKASDSLVPNSGLAVVVFNTYDPLPTAADRAITELQ